MNITDTPLAERTQAHPIEWLCCHPACRNENGERFKFTSEYPECPKCSQTIPIVQMIALVHLLVPSPDGPLKGQSGNFFIACDPTRDYTATTVNREAASNRTSVVNCPGCNKWLTDNHLSTITDSLLIQGK